MRRVQLIKSKTKSKLSEINSDWYVDVYNRKDDMPSRYKSSLPQLTFFSTTLSVPSSAITHS